MERCSGANVGGLQFGTQSSVLPTGRDQQQTKSVSRTSNVVALLAASTAQLVITVTVLLLNPELDLFRRSGMVRGSRGCPLVTLVLVCEHLHVFRGRADIRRRGLKAFLLASCHRVLSGRLHTQGLKAFDVCRRRVPQAKASDKRRAELRTEHIDIYLRAS